MAAVDIENIANTPMFCFQCEQRKGNGCTDQGDCGKTSDVAVLQDLLVYLLKGLSQVCKRAKPVGINTVAADRALIHGLFATLTNVNNDAARFHEFCKEVISLREDIVKQLKAKNLGGDLSGSAVYVLPVPDMAAGAKKFGVQARQKAFGEDVAGVQELSVYGMKGAAAYACHCLALGAEDDKVYARMHGVMAFLEESPDKADLGKLLGQALEVGALNLRVLEMLDQAHTDHYGAPTPTKVHVGPVAGKCILVTGHDLVDLEALLKQTEGKGINVFTHGEMLPAHGYPKLKAYKHLVGHWGRAWQLQRTEFNNFPGPILATTNCIISPTDYKYRLFTRSVVGWPGVQHIPNTDFSKVIASALAEKGFDHTEQLKEHLVGFGHKTVLGVADKVIDAATKTHQLKHIFLIGGCDGAAPGRNYYKKLATSLPKDTLILTVGCGKYRINDADYGMLGDTGLPRLLDMGQCNDSYAAVRVALGLAEALKTDVNHLPLSLVLSWFEQKAVAVLLTLLHLGVQKVRIGPTVPAFLTPAVIKVLVEKFQLTPVGKVDEDLKIMMA